MNRYAQSIHTNVGPPISTAENAKFLLDQSDRPEWLKWVRSGAYLLAGVICIVFPAAGPNRLFLAAFLILIGAPANFLLQRFSYVSEIDRWHNASDVLTVLVAAPLVPAVYAPLALTATASLASYSTTTTKLKLAYLASLLIDLSLVGAYYNIQSWYLVVLIFPIVVVPPMVRGKNAVSRMDLALDRLESLIQSSRGLLWEYDPTKQAFTKAQGPTEDVLGISPEQTLRILNNTQQAQEAAENITEDESSETTVALSAFVGQHTWFRFTGHRRARGDGSRIIQGVAFDVTELEKSRTILRHRAERDSLTGLPNRDGLAHFVDKHMKPDARQNNERTQLAILLLDLDRFKQINDTLGHPVGDKVIRTVAHRLETLSRSDICVARLGGDEFAVAVIGHQVEIQQKAVEIGERILALNSQPIKVDQMELTTSVSVGVAIGNPENLVDLMRTSDIAMYDAKQEGGGLRRYQPKSSSHTLNRLTLQSEVSQSLESEITLHYQPIVDSQTHDVVAVEAMPRWLHPTHGLLTPENFMNVIISGGLTSRLDTHIISRAGAVASEMAAEDIRVCVNLSARSLRSPALRDEFLRLITANPDTAANLTVEITEQGLPDDHKRMKATFDRLQELGIELCLDGYGTGTSSLNRLRSLPFTEVKIGSSFVRGVVNDTTDRSIVRSTLSLAHELGLRTACDGVATNEQAELLTEWGASRLQGPLFGLPEPLERARRGGPSDQRSLRA